MRAIMSCHSLDGVRTSQIHTYLDMFVTDGSQNKMKYSNPKYDEIIMKAKKMEAM